MDDDVEMDSLSSSLRRSVQDEHLHDFKLGLGEYGRMLKSTNNTTTETYSESEENPVIAWTRHSLINTNIRASKYDVGACSSTSKDKDDPVVEDYTDNLFRQKAIDIECGKISEDSIDLESLEGKIVRYYRGYYTFYYRKHHRMSLDNPEAFEKSLKSTKKDKLD